LSLPRLERRRSFPFGVVLLAGLWLGVDGWLIAPGFGQFDIYYFKDAGINFAEGLGLTTRFSYGNPSFDYRDYSQYPPLYPLLFGLYTRAVGVSALANQVYNSLLAVLVGLVGYWALRPVVGVALRPRWRRAAELGLAVLLVGVGFEGFSDDRPDGLATAFGLGGVVFALRGRGLPSGIGAGMLCALAAFTSPFGGLYAASAALAGVLALGYREAQSPHRRAVALGVGGAGAVLLLLLALKLGLPGWFDGFFGVASGANTQNETGGGYFLALLHGDFATWRQGFAYGSIVPLTLLLKLLAVAAALGATVLRALPLTGAARRAALSLAPLWMLSPACLVLAPYQSNYALISAALLLGTWAALETRMPSGGRWAALAIVAALTVDVALSAPMEIKERLVRHGAGASLPRARRYLDDHLALLETPGAFTAVSPTTYILWREAGLHPLITVYSGWRVPANRGRALILALSYPGSGDPLRPQLPDTLPLSEYRPIFAPDLPQQTLVLGRPVSTSSQTWESAVYVRAATR
jgi:hypothetical protein